MKPLHSVRPQPILKSLPLRGAWIETHGCIRSALAARSLPLRGAWIETTQLCIT